MEKSMSLLKKEHENKYSELTKILNKLKTQIIQRDIDDYCGVTGFHGVESSIYGKEIANNIYARAGEATGGDICLLIEDRRKEAFLWLFEIEFDTEFYQVPYIFTQESDNLLDNLVYVKNIKDGIEDEGLESLTQVAIERLNRSINIVKSFDVKTVGYSYSCDSPKTDKVRKFADIVDYILQYKKYIW